MGAEITPSFLLAAYESGYFPMARHRADPELFWFSPDPRGILPLGQFHIPRSLKKLLARQPFDIRWNTAFEKTIHGCAARESTWISHRIIQLYTELWRMGHAHSIELWKDDVLLGGLYGVALGRAFFAESMFSRVPNASKIALAHLVEKLRQQGCILLDVQYVTLHLRQFGAVEIPRAEYLVMLRNAMEL